MYIIFKHIYFILPPLLLKLANSIIDILLKRYILRIVKILIKFI